MKSAFPPPLALFVALLVVLGPACASRGSEPTRDPDDAATSAGAGGQSADGCALGSQCTLPCGGLRNHFCGRKCENSPGQQAGLNCGRACVGEPDEIRGSNCTPPQPDGGIYGRCRKAGEEIEAKVLGAYCCDGLKRITQDRPSAGGCVEGDAPPSLLVCADCGDASCASYENVCNCPEDCAQ